MKKVIVTLKIMEEISVEVEVEENFEQIMNMTREEYFQYMEELEPTLGSPFLDYERRFIKELVPENREYVEESFTIDGYSY